MWTPPVFLWGADDNEWEPDSLEGGTWVGEPVGGDETNVAEVKATVASALAPAAKVWSEILAMENEKEGAGVTTARSLRVLSRRLWLTTHRRALPRTRRGLSSGSSG